MGVGGDSDWVRGVAGSVDAAGVWRLLVGMEAEQEQRYQIHDMDLISQLELT